jgi:DNA-directed RNA polymerase subunit RPC12/RpoP
MPLEVKQFNCPKCGSPLDIKNAARSKTIVCPSCGSQIDLGPAHAVLGTVGPRPAPKLTQFQIGMKGTLAGEQHEIIGRVLYRDNQGYTWDEWILLSAAGDYRWLSDDEDEGVVLWHIFTPTQPLDPNTVRDGQTINLTGDPVHVTEVTHATIAYMEGELIWKAKVGDTIRALDAAGPQGEMFSIEWTGDQIEFYRGERMNRADAAVAFGLPAISRPTTANAADDDTAGDSTRAARVQTPIGGILSIVLFIIIFCVCVGAVFGAGGGSSCYATPAPVRTVSCTSHISFGGGSGGGSGGGFGGGHSGGGGGGK